MKTPRFFSWLLCLICGFFPPPFCLTTVRADGGVLRAHSTHGPLTFTLFSPADLSKDLPTDLTLLVQESASQSVVLDATVSFRFLPPPGTILSPTDRLCGPAFKSTGASPPPLPISASIPATHADATNRLLYGSTVLFRASGLWQIEITVARGEETFQTTALLPITPPPHRLAFLWPYLLIPPLGIALFLFAFFSRRRGDQPPSSP
ncbi:MAG: hypothetical protein WCI46_04810 [Verrucomicrobiota bacterium]